MCSLNAGCQIVNKVFNINDLLSALPSFADVVALPSFGYSIRGASLSLPLPTTKSLASTVPQTIYAQGMAIQRWEMARSFSNGMHDVQTLEINSDNRVLTSYTKLLDGKGQMVQENWQTYGQLEVYNTAAVPNTVFSLPQQVRGGCHA